MIRNGKGWDTKELSPLSVPLRAAFTLGADLLLPYHHVSQESPNAYTLRVPRRPSPMFTGSITGHFTVSTGHCFY